MFREPEKGSVINVSRGRSESRAWSHVDIAGGADNGLGTGMRDGAGGNESRAGVECGERDECLVATEGGINSVR